jgi:hypothetical protein
MSEMEEKDLLPLMIERLGHLESILATSSFGLFLTTTIAAYTAVYKLDPELGGQYALPLIVGTSVAYAFLSGYYYIMLTNFCATAAILLSKDFGRSQAFKIVNTIWDFFRLPGFIPINARRRQMLHMLNVALFPFLFSTISIIGISFLVHDYSETNWFWITVTLCVCLQAITFLLIMWHPWQKFSRAVGKIANHSSEQS